MTLFYQGVPSFFPPPEMAEVQRAAATNGPDPDPGPDPGTGAGFRRSTISILDNHVLDNHVLTSQTIKNEHTHTDGLKSDLVP